MSIPILWRVTVCWCIIVMSGLNSVDDIIRDGSQLENGKLKADITYKTGEFDYIYKTDSKGRISNWSTDDL